MISNHLTKEESGEREEKMSGATPDNVESKVLNKLVETIQAAQSGLDPDILASWYAIIESDSKLRCPSQELRDSIRVIQNLDLPMKFEFKSSKRAIPFVVEDKENNLPSIPFATRLYFEKFE